MNATFLRPSFSYRRRHPGLIIWLTALCALLFGPSGIAHAETLTVAAATQAARSLVLEAGVGRVVPLDGAAANVFVADPKVVEVRPASATSLFIFGVGMGRTTVAALDSTGKPVAQFTITVQPSSFGASQAQETIAKLVPGSHVKVQASAHGLMLTGTVADPQAAAQAVAVARGYTAEGQTVDDQMSVTSAVQVTLSVRMAEMNRTVVRQIGVNWQALGNFGQISRVFPALTVNINSAANNCVASGTNPLCLGGSFNSVIDALAQDSLVHVLAEPNLTVMSGQKASFQVGGEFPIPVAQQAGAVSVDFKNYGVSLSFLPTVYSDGRINLHVMPEVSQISSQNSVSVTTSGSTLLIPSLTVRRAESTVELGSGETFAIAGLLQDTTSDAKNGLPGLGDMPTLGALFRNTNYNRSEDELVILVTPYISRPVAQAASMQLPDRGYGRPTEIERLFEMRQANPGQTAQRPMAIPGAAGFMVQ